MRAGLTAEINFAISKFQTALGVSGMMLLPLRPNFASISEKRFSLLLSLPCKIFHEQYAGGVRDILTRMVLYYFCSPKRIHDGHKTV